jgi:hypothetical protein
MKNSLSKTAVRIAVLALTLIPLFIKSAEAEFRVTPSIRLGQGWDSNIFETSDNVVSDFYTTVTPELAIATSGQNLGMQLLAGAEGRWYYDNPDVSSAGYSKYLRLTAIDNGWRPTPRFSMSPAAYFLETRSSTARAFLIPVDPTVPPQEIGTFGLQKSRDFGASIGLRYQATPRLETAGTVYGAARQFPDQPGGDSDSRTVGADVSVRHAISQKSTAGVYGSGSKDYFEDTPDALGFAVGLLAGHQFSPAFRIDGRLGMSFIRQSASATDNSDHSSSDPSGTLTLAYAHGTFLASLYGNFGYSGLSGAVTRMQTVGISFADQFAQRWSWILGGNYQARRTVFEAATRDDDTVNGTGTITYAPWAWGSFNLTGNATRQQSDVPGGDMTRYSVVLGFTLGKTYTGL